MQKLYNHTLYTPSLHTVAKRYCLALQALRFDKVLNRQGKATLFLSNITLPEVQVRHLTLTLCLLS